MAAKVKVVEQEFRVPSLSECDPEYAAIVDRVQKISTEHGTNRREQAELEADLKNRPAVNAVRAGLADLIGDTVEVDGRPAKLNELRKRGRDLDEAVAILSKRQNERRPFASGKVCEAVKPEYTRRVAAFVAALLVAHEARIHFESLLDDLESEDIAWLRLGIVRQSWMGEIRGGRVDQFIKEAKEKGYV